MSTTNSGDQQSLPIGHTAALRQLEKSGARQPFSFMRYRLVGVNDVKIEQRYRRQLVANPNWDTFWGFIFESPIIEIGVPDLSELYVNGVPEGWLNSNSEGSAAAIRQMLADRPSVPVNLIVSGHFTGQDKWLIDSIEIEPPAKSG